MRVNEIFDQPIQYAIKIVVSNRASHHVKYFQEDYLKGKSLEQADHIGYFTTDGFGEHSPTLYADKSEAIKQAKRIQSVCNQISTDQSNRFGSFAEYFVKPVIWKGQEV